MLEQLSSIRYTGQVDGTLYGYTLIYNGGTTYTARVVLITPTGDKPACEVEVPTFRHDLAVNEHMQGWLFT